MRINRVRRTVLLTVAVVIATVMMVATVVVVLSQPRYPGPLEVELTDELLDTLGARDAEDQLLRERLGGLAALVTDDDTLAGCTDAPGPVRVPANAADADPVDLVLTATEQVRELTLHDPVDVQLIDHAEMTDRIVDYSERRWHEERVDVEHRKLTALGAVDPGTDLAGLRVDAFAEQVSGYFDPGEAEIGVRVADPETLSPLEQVVLAHEFEHALTWQNLDRPAVDSADAARAASAVVEGSAVLAMRMYAESVLTARERAELREELLARAAADALAGHSRYLRAELRFPYVEGVRYACEVWREGGWEAVNAAYEDPPQTTAAVLFPDRHGEAPRRPVGLGGPDDRWDEVRSTDVGAAQLEWLLAAPGGDPEAALDEPRERAGAWDGGDLTVWSQHELTAVGLALVDRGAGPPLCETMRMWYEAAFPHAQAAPGAAARTDGPDTTFAGDDQHAALVCDGDQVRLGLAPDAGSATAIAG